MGIKEEKKETPKKPEQVLIDKEFLGQITGAYTKLSKQVEVLSGAMEKFGISQVNKGGDEFLYFEPLMFAKGEVIKNITPEQKSEMIQRMKLFKPELYALMKKYKVGRIMASILKKL